MATSALKPAPPKAPLGKAARNKRLLLIGGAVVGAILLGLYFRSRLSTGGGGSSSTGASPTDLGSAGGAGSGPDLMPLEDLAAALNGYTAVLGAGPQTIFETQAAEGVTSVPAPAGPAAPVAGTSPSPQAILTSDPYAGSFVLPSLRATAPLGNEATLAQIGQAVTGSGGVSNASIAASNEQAWGSIVGNYLPPQSHDTHPVVHQVVGTNAQLAAGQAALNTPAQPKKKGKVMV